jgi:zinc/manganese transport system substrate-binding protein
MRRCALAWIALLVASTAAGAQDIHRRVSVVASFSILADLVDNVGGDRVAVSALIGPDGDAHVYEPSPSDSRRMADAALVVVNGLGYEGWLDRLVAASGAKARTVAPIVVASAGVAPRLGDDDHGRIDDHSAPDPHAWQSIANVERYVANIRDALSKADPAGASVYAANAAAYLTRLEALEREIQQALAGIPAERRRVITGHRAFGYFQDAYGIAFLAPQGVSAEAEPSARDVARVIMQIRTQRIRAVFLENVVDPRLVEAIARDTGARIGGTLYSDALTAAGGPAPTYIDLMRHNARTLAAALGS